jgi:uncharacterized protein YkwD
MKRADLPNSLPIAAPQGHNLVAIWFGAWAIGMLALTAAFIQSTWLTPVAAQAAVAGASSSLAERVISQANQVRQQQGLDVLSTDARLTQAAQVKAEDMIRRGYFAHFYQTSTPWQFIDATGYTDWHFAGENLAKNYNTADDLISAWLASPAHRDNLLSTKYHQTGVATVTGRTPVGELVTVTVQLFTGS